MFDFINNILDGIGKFVIHEIFNGLHPFYRGHFVRWRG